MTTAATAWVVELKNLELRNPLNGAQWRRHGRTAPRKAARAAVLAHLLARVGLARPPLPVVVTITRVGPQTLDTDNVVGAAKHIRDSVARYLGVDDGPASGVSWHYEQRRGKYAVEIRIEREVRDADVG